MLVLVVSIRSKTAGALAVSCIIAAFSAHAQVWLIDFDNSTDMGMQTHNVTYIPPDPPADVSYGVVDTGAAISAPCSLKA